MGVELVGDMVPMRDKKSKKKSKNGCGLGNGEEVERIVANSSVEMKKSKKDDREKKLEEEKDRGGGKDRKKRKLECVSNAEDEDIEAVVLKDGKKRKKGSKNKKVEKDEDSDGHKEKELDDVEVSGKKKGRKDEMSCENKEGGKEVEVERERNDEVNVFVHVEDGDEDVAKRKKRKSKKNKEKEKSIANDEERNANIQIEGLPNIDPTDGKKKKKKKKSKDETENCLEEKLEELSNKEDTVVSANGTNYENKECGKEVEIKHESNDEVNVSMEDADDDVAKRKKKKSKKNKEKDKSIVNDEERTKNVQIEGLSNIDPADGKKKRKKQRKSKDESENCSEEIIEEVSNKEDSMVDANRTSSVDGHSGAVGKEKRVRKKSEKSTRKKAKSVKDVKDKNVNEEEIETQNKEKNADHSGDRRPKNTSKRVKFSDKDEIFPLLKGGDVKKKNQKDGMVRGKRFTEDEDETLRKAVLNYVEEHCLGEDGVEMVMRCHKYSETKNCWKEISAAMPWRPLAAIYSRSHILFERDEKREWTQEEIDLLKEFHEKHGPDWRKFADEYGKSRIHVKDLWRRIGNPNRKKGAWSQEEYQKYFDLVNMDLRMKVFTEKKIKHGMLKDNIAWEAISSQLDTRSNADCCKKWYGEMQSPLVKAGMWSNCDDFRLIIELSERDYSSVEEVDWDDLLDHRDGALCRKRWHQMVRHTGEHGKKSFADQVEVLMKRYCPDVLEPRQIYEDKVPVD